MDENTTAEMMQEDKLKKQYEEASRRVDTLQRASVNVPGGYHRCMADEGYSFAFVSKSFEKIVGYTKKQLEDELDNKFINLVIPEDLARFERLENEIEESGSGNVAYRIRRRDGEIRWVQDSTLLTDWEGEPCYQCTLSDITEFVQQQNQIAKEKAELEKFAEKIPCGYHRCSTDDGFRLEFVSDSFVETIGYAREEVLGKSYIELVAPEDREYFMSHESALVDDGKVELAYRVVRKDGEIRWIKDSTVRISHGNKDAYQCILADITEFVNKQEEIAQKNIKLMQKKALSDILEQNMPSGYHRCKAENGCPFIYIGAHLTDIVGYTREEIETELGNLYKNSLWPEDIDVIHTYEDMIKMRGKGNVYDTSVYRVKHKLGGYRWVTDSTMFVDMGEESFFQSTISDITEYIEELNEAKKEAEASNLAKSTFLFNASHDIRTPMNAILGFANIIDNNTDNPHLVKETIRKIIQSSQTLMTLINDVLDLSRIEQGKEEVDEQLVDMQTHADKLYEMFVSEMQDAGITFNMENDIRHPMVLGDELKLTRIAMNLLSNAKKFTPRGGTVTFGIAEKDYDGDGATYCLFVRDNGIGMSEEFQSHAFEQFEREHSSTDSGVTGSGLGLAIIKRFCDLMNGKCELKSKLGEGTEITVAVPLKSAKDNSGQIENTFDEISFFGKRVLVVEDNEFNREIAKYVFEDMGFEVDMAENGVICIDRITAVPAEYYDLILMDVQMPVMNGYAATAEIRNLSDKAKSQIPIIAMTANAFDTDRQKCLEIGMNGHIGKPLEAERIIKEITKVLL